MILNFISLFVLFLLVVLLFLAVLFLGAIPGKIAKQRNHPQAEAINICGWVGIFTGGLLWIIALIWAYTKAHNRHS